MTESKTIGDDSSFPCPRCGYDLRAHPDQTRCPECGGSVTQSFVLGNISRWVDMSLLDLWSIAILQSTGLFCMVFAILAVRAGQYVAVGLGLAAFFHLVVATCWYLALLVQAFGRLRTRSLHRIPRHRRRNLWGWYLLDSALVAVLPLVLLLLG